VYVAGIARFYSNAHVSNIAKTPDSRHKASIDSASAPSLRPRLPPDRTLAGIGATKNRVSLTSVE
jgi:hypothetical protein